MISKKQLFFVALIMGFAQLVEGNTMNNAVDLQEDAYITQTINAWQTYMNTKTNWRELVGDVVPKHTGNGAIYELPNFLNRPNESFAVCDMRELLISEPHYHPDNDIEIYFVLEGSARVVVGNNEHCVNKGDVVIIPSNTAHFTIPNDEFVMGIVNTPPFKFESYIVVNQTNSDVNFDYEHFIELTMQCNAKEKIW